MGGGVEAAGAESASACGSDASGRSGVVVVGGGGGIGEEAGAIGEAGRTAAAGDAGA